MDSSKIHEGTEECSSSESGWTTYIASPDHELDQDDDEDEDDEDRSIGEPRNKQDADEDVDSDDSMASDASSGPSHQGNFLVGTSLYAGTKDERKISGKKEKKQHDEKIKAAKNMFGHKANSAGRSKKT